jgi:hypothetical protein
MTYRFACDSGRVVCAEGKQEGLAPQNEKFPQKHVKSILKNALKKSGTGLLFGITLLE